MAARSQNAFPVPSAGCWLPGPEEEVCPAGHARLPDACIRADLPLCSAAVSRSVASFAAAADAAAGPRQCRSSGDRAAPATEQLVVVTRRSCLPSGRLLSLIHI